MSVYLDCAATTPLHPQVKELLVQCLDPQFGNGGSRHSYGLRARKNIEKARDQVAGALGVRRGEVLFTSGATESNNIAILGLEKWGRESGCKHLISTLIEHHAVLEPSFELSQRGFRRSLIKPEASGQISVDAVLEELSQETALVSVMHVNNETGIAQPITAIAEALKDHKAYLHVDAAQGFGKDLESLKHPRIDMISISGHKIHAPMGIGALITRRRGRERPSLEPRFFGGGQELGVRPGTLPAPLIAAFGLAAELVVSEKESRRQACTDFEDALLKGLAPLRPKINGDPNVRKASIINMSFPGVDSESLMEAWADLVAISNGAACTSQSYSCSHVLGAMGLEEERILEAVRLSWCAFTPKPDFPAMIRAFEKLREDMGHG